MSLLMAVAVFPGFVRGFSSNQSSNGLVTFKSLDSGIEGRDPARFGSLMHGPQFCPREPRNATQSFWEALRR